jgi:archaellum component FlaC
VEKSLSLGLEAAAQASILAAVQEVLDRHAIAVIGETARVLADAVQSRQALTQANQAFARTLAEQIDGLELGLDGRIAEAEQRSSRGFEEITSGLHTIVERVDTLDANVKMFDEQAAHLVVHVNEATDRFEDRLAQTSTAIEDQVTNRTERLEELLDASAAALEGRLHEELGVRIAEIDAHVRQVSTGLDDALKVFNDRLGSIEQVIGSLDERIEAMREELTAVDTESLDELKESLSTAAGEAMLVRIDLEHLEKKTGEQMGAVMLRMVSVEEQLADTTMDVSTAIQFERLEELERAVIELDPSRFVLRDGGLVGEPSDTDAGG